MTDTLLSPRGRVLVLVLIIGPATRKMLEEVARLSDRSVERIVGSLEDAGLIASHVTRTGGPKWWSVRDGVSVTEELLRNARPDVNGRSDVSQTYA